MSGITYECSSCGKKVTVEEGKPVPVCCRKEMEPLPYCTKVPNAEMSRGHEEEEPCDDGTMPRRR